MNPSLVQALCNVTSFILIQNIAITTANAVLIRNTKHYKGKIISEVPFIDRKTVEERKREIQREKVKELWPYVEKLKSYTTEENLKTTYRNLQNIKLKKKCILFGMGTSGSYNAKKNRIIYRLNSTIGHELLHLASAYYDEKSGEYHVGFRQRKKMAQIGKGLNEGYTELLASRIYNKKNKATSYLKEVKIAKLLELFFDDPKEMEQYYFNHNLPGFIHHMEKYMPREEVLQLLRDLDTMNYFSFILGPVPIYKSIKIQKKLYQVFREKNKDSQKLRTFEEILNQDQLTALMLKKQKVKLEKTFQKGTPIFHQFEQSNISSSNQTKEIKTFETPTGKINRPRKRPEIGKSNQKQILELLLPYRGMKFDQLCCELFSVPKEQINIMQATRLYCMMTGTTLPSDFKKQIAVFRQVQSLVLPENEKMPLDYYVGHQLQEKIDSIWDINIIEKNMDIDRNRKVS